MDEQLKNKFIELINTYEKGGDLESLIKTALKVKTLNINNIQKKLDEYRTKQVEAAIESNKNPFAAYMVAKEYNIKSEKLTSDFKALDEDFRNEFFKQFFEKGTIDRYMQITYIDLLQETYNPPNIGLFNPLTVMKDFGVKAELHPNLVNSFNEKEFGIFGKCVIYYDVDNKKFVLEANPHKELKIYANKQLSELPRIIFNDGEELGYHKQIFSRHENIVKFGGARFVLLNDGFYFFHRSIDFGPMPKELTLACVEGSNVTLHPEGISNLDRQRESFAEYFLSNNTDRFYRQLTENSFQRPSTNDFEELEQVETYHQQEESQQLFNFQNEPSRNNFDDDGDDLPF